MSRLSLSPAIYHPKSPFHHSAATTSRRRISAAARGGVDATAHIASGEPQLLISWLHAGRHRQLEQFLEGVDDKDRYGRCEYWDGEVIPKDPDFGEPIGPVKAHSYVQARLALRLGLYLDARSAGSVHTELHCLLPGTARVLVPDLAVILGPFGDPGPLRTAPDLVVEILSPTDRESWMRRKIETYLGCGVRMVRIIDPQRRQAWMYQAHPLPRSVAESGSLTGNSLLPGLEIPLKSILPPSTNK